MGFTSIILLHQCFLCLCLSLHADCRLQAGAASIWTRVIWIKIMCCRSARIPQYWGNTYQRACSCWGNLAVEDQEVPGCHIGLRYLLDKPPEAGVEISRSGVCLPVFASGALLDNILPISVHKCCSKGFGHGILWNVGQVEAFAVPLERGSCCAVCTFLLLTT